MLDLIVSESVLTQFEEELETICVDEDDSACHCEVFACSCSNACGTDYSRGNCSCSSSCGSDYARNGSCSCSSSCGSDYSRE